MEFESDESKAFVSKVIVDDEHHPVDYELLQQESLSQLEDGKIVNEQELRQKMEELILTTLHKELRESEDELKRQLEVIYAFRELIALGDERYKTLVNNSHDIIYCCDCQGAFTTVNRKFCEVVGLPNERIIGKFITNFQRDLGYIKEWNNAFFRAANDGVSNSFTYTYEREAGSGIGYYEVTLTPLYDLKREIIGVIGTNHDLTLVKEIENVIKHQAYYDYITDLPSRVHFLERLMNAIKLAKKNAIQLIVVILDLDNFKVVNDTFGHSMGDMLLVETSTRLIKCIDEEKAMVARLSGDEFAMLLESEEIEEEIVNLLDKIRLLFEEPFIINNDTINLTACIGISIYPDDGDTNEELLNNATTAMYKAKKFGSNRFQIFNFKMKYEFMKKTNIERLLRKAIQRNEFVLHYQPQYTISGRLRGFEALIRWYSPEIGFLSPMEFIPIAEETGLIIQIGEWVLKEAINTCKKFEDKYGCDLIMAVNISPIQLRQKAFGEILINLINASGVKLSNIELEITESCFIDNFDRIAKELEHLRILGVGIALDDFGTGYSSLSYLKKLPISLLKIDKSFVQEIDYLNPYNNLTESIIALVNRLNIKTIAEGIETLEQFNYLINAKCDYVQGYYFGKPIPDDLIGDIIEKGCTLFS